MHFCRLSLVALLLTVVTSEFSTPDTWSACDGLGRVLPSYEEVGDLRPNKSVGIFYFLWAENQAGQKRGPYDVTKILAQSAGSLINATAWGPLYEFHHWSQPYFDYYLMDDEFVIRKHAQMLSDAGVDTLIMDATNAFTYDNIWSKIAAIYMDMRSKSQRTPRICFITWSSCLQTVQRLYENLYSKNLYRDLWFEWNGKPLIFTNSDGFPSYLLEFFTIRESWAWTRGQSWYGDGRNKWPWIDNYPQGRGYDGNGQLEQTCVSVAGHPVTNIGRSYDGPDQYEPSQVNPSNGTYFSEQWKQALSIDPSFIFVTGWNEWIAQRFVQTSAKNSFIGKQWPIGTTYFVDEFVQEYSRDIEPMLGGHEDNYYYQLISFVRRFKGVSKPSATSSKATILINQNFTQWINITPAFVDDAFDTPSRNHSRYGDQGGQLTDFSQRNDFVEMKVAHDDDYFYFYARSNENWFDGNQFNWLFLNTDNNYTTGWIGFDYLVDLGSSQLKRSIDNDGHWAFQESISIANSGINELHFSIAYRSILVEKTKINIKFKWFSSENIYTHDPLKFIDKGDSAPNGRFTYNYVATDDNKN